MEILDISDNQLTSLTLPDGLLNLLLLELYNNCLTSLTLPAGLVSLERLHLRGNPLESLRVPEGVDVENIHLIGFSESEVTFYDPAPAAGQDAGVEGLDSVE